MKASSHNLCDSAFCAKATTLSHAHSPSTSIDQRSCRSALVAARAHLALHYRASALTSLANRQHGKTEFQRSTTAALQSKAAKHSRGLRSVLLCYRVVVPPRLRHRYSSGHQPKPAPGKPIDCSSLAPSKGGGDWRAVCVRHECQ